MNFGKLPKRKQHNDSCSQLYNFDVFDIFFKKSWPYLITLMNHFFFRELSHFLICTKLRFIFYRAVKWMSTKKVENPSQSSQFLRIISLKKSWKFNSIWIQINIWISKKYFMSMRIEKKSTMNEKMLIFRERNALKFSSNSFKTDRKSVV